MLLAVAADLAVHVDQAAGVHHEVGRIENPARGEGLGQRLVGELVVRAAADDLATQEREVRGVDGAAQRARREDVAFGDDLLVGLDPARPKLLGDAALGRIDVRGRHLGAMVHQPSRELRADVPETGDHDPAPGELWRSEANTRAGAHRRFYAHRRERAGIARAATLGRKASDVLGALVDDHQVRRGHADVLRRDVPAAQGLDEIAEIQQQIVALPSDRGPCRPADDALPTTEIQPRGGGLERHATGQTQRVADGIGRRRVVPQPGPAEGGSQGSRVDRNDHVVPAARAAMEHQVLVLERYRSDRAGLRL